MEGRAKPVAYALFWLGLLALFVVVVWLVISRGPRQPLPPGALETGAVRDSSASPSIDEDLGTTDLTLKGAQLTVSSGDGKLQMRVWADLGSKRENVYAIEEGALQFTLGSRDTLLLKLSNATYRKEAGLVKVKGSLTGYITEGAQHFVAEELSWDQSTRTVSTNAVRYVGQSLEVSGERMSIDLETGVVRFDGPVEVGV